MFKAKTIFKKYKGSFKGLFIQPHFYHIEIKDLQEAPAVKRNTYYFRSFLTFVRVFLFSYVKTNTVSHLEFMLYIKVRLR